MKIFSNIVNRTDEHALDAAIVEQATALITQRMPLFVQSGDLEVQERAVFAVELMKLVAQSLIDGLVSLVMQLSDADQESLCTPLSPRCSTAS